MNLCPTCSTPGRTVSSETLRALVLPSRLDQILETELWFFCSSEACVIVYFCADEVVVGGDVSVVPPQKTKDPARLVCFCFGHTKADIEADVAQNGSSKIRESIKAACRAGEDDCVRRNPQGRCCLANVGDVVRRASDGAKEGSG